MNGSKATPNIFTNFYILIYLPENVVHLYICIYLFASRSYFRVDLTYM